MSSDLPTYDSEGKILYNPDGSWCLGCDCGGGNVPDSGGPWPPASYPVDAWVKWTGFLMEPNPGFPFSSGILNAEYHSNDQDVLDAGVFESPHVEYVHPLIATGFNTFLGNEYPHNAVLSPVNADGYYGKFNSHGFYVELAQGATNWEITLTSDPPFGPGEVIATGVGPVKTGRPWGDYTTTSYNPSGIGFLANTVSSIDNIQLWDNDPTL